MRSEIVVSAMMVPAATTQNQTIPLLWRPLFQTQAELKTRLPMPRLFGHLIVHHSALIFRRLNCNAKFHACHAETQPIFTTEAPLTVRQNCFLRLPCQ